MVWTNIIKFQRRTRVCVCFFVIEEKKSKQPASATKPSCFSHEKIPHYTTPPPSHSPRPYVIAWQIPYRGHKTKLRFGAKRLIFFGKDYPHGYSKKVCRNFLIKVVQLTTLFQFLFGIKKNNFFLRVLHMRQ